MKRGLLAFLIALSWVAFLGVARLTTDSSKCDNWCAVGDAASLVIVFGLPVALVGLWQLMQGMEGPALEVGFPEPTKSGRTRVGKATVGPAGDPPRLRIAFHADRFVRIAEVHVVFQQQEIATSNLVLKEQDKSWQEVFTNVGGRTQWNLEIRDLLNHSVRVTWVELKDLPPSLHEIKVGLNAFSEGSRGPVKKTLTLQLPAAPAVGAKAQAEVVPKV